MAKKKTPKSAAVSRPRDSNALHAIERLYESVRTNASTGLAISKSGRVLSRGREQIAKKLGEEAIEAMIEGVRADRPKLVSESADVLFYLVALWADVGIKPKAVWAELDRREGLRP